MPEVPPLTVEAKMGQIVPPMALDIKFWAHDSTGEQSLHEASHLKNDARK